MQVESGSVSIWKWTKEMKQKHLSTLPSKQKIYDSDEKYNTMHLSDDMWDKLSITLDTEDLVEKEINIVLGEYVLSQMHVVLTPTQYAVWQGLLQGIAQTKIADNLGINQSTISKTLYGVPQYSAKGKPMRGGIFRKIRKWSQKDELYKQFQELLQAHKNGDLDEKGILFVLNTLEERYVNSTIKTI